MKILRSLIVATAVLAAPIAAGGQMPEPGKKNVEGVTNFTQLDATIACAGATQASAVPELKRLGFASILNLRLASEEGADVEGEKAAAEAAGLKYHHIPFNTPRTPEENVDATVQEFLRVTSAPDNYPLFLHCAGGGRASAMWLIKRVKVDGWDVEKARAEAAQVVEPPARAVEWAVEYLKAKSE
jgi:uncharacterized protein (TIGR01244 family)